MNPAQRQQLLSRLPDHRLSPSELETRHQMHSCKQFIMCPQHDMSGQTFYHDCKLPISKPVKVSLVMACTYNRPYCK